MVEVVHELEVLLIEDEALSRTLVRACLERRDHGLAPARVEVEESLAGGLRALATRGFDVVLLDLNVADSAGLATYRAIDRENARAQGPPLVIRVTAAKWDWRFEYPGGHVETGTANVTQSDERRHRLAVRT